MSTELSGVAPRPLHLATTRWLRRTAPVMVWMALISGVALWGAALIRSDPEIALGAPPLFGKIHPRVSWEIGIPLVLAGAAIAWGFKIARELPWRTLLLTSGLAAVAWAVSLALLDGGDALTRPLLGSHDYLVEVDRIDSLPHFLAQFTDRLPAYSIHVQGHPPGMVSLLWLMDRGGMAGAGWATAVTLAAAASGVVAVLIAVRALAGETLARCVAPFLAFAPLAVWVATSADAFFMGIAAWAVTLGVVAARARRHGPLIAFAGGLMFGITLLLSYGLVLMGLVVVAIAVALHRWRWLAPYALGALAPLLGMWLAGFAWWEGLAATRERYLAGVSSHRPFAFFAIANLAALAVATGPAVAAALTSLRERRLGLIIGGAALAIAVADLSGMSKGEVERIWLPFALWLSVATAYLVRSRRRNWWLAAQCATALAVQVVVVTPW